MSELTNVKEAILDILGDISDKEDVDREDLYFDIQDDICVRGICGSMDCYFCPLGTLESFYKEYGDMV